MSAMLGNWVTIFSMIFGDNTQIFFKSKVRYDSDAPNFYKTSVRWSLVGWFPNTFGIIQNLFGHPVWKMFKINVTDNSKPSSLDETNEKWFIW